MGNKKFGQNISEIGWESGSGILCTVLFQFVFFFAGGFLVHEALATLFPSLGCLLVKSHELTGSLLPDLKLSRFPKHKVTRSIATPPGWDASPSQVILLEFHQVSLIVHQYPFILLGGERHCESKVSCRRQQKDHSQGWDSDFSALNVRTPRLPQFR